MPKSKRGNIEQFGKQVGDIERNVSMQNVWDTTLATSLVNRNNVNHELYFRWLALFIRKRWLNYEA